MIPKVSQPIVALERLEEQIIRENNLKENELFRKPANPSPSNSRKRSAKHTFQSEFIKWEANVNKRSKSLPKPPKPAPEPTSLPVRKPTSTIVKPSPNQQAIEPSGPNAVTEAKAIDPPIKKERKAENVGKKSTGFVIFDPWAPDNHWNEMLCIPSLRKARSIFLLNHTKQVPTRYFHAFNSNIKSLVLSES